MSESSGIIMPRRTLITDLGWSGPVSSGSTFPCSGTTISMTNPNMSIGGGGWTSDANLARVDNVSDPLGGTSATELTPAATLGGFATSITQPLGTLTGGVTYSFSGYFKTVVAPSWILFGVSDNIANAFSVWFNLSGSGTVGSSNLAGTGSVTCKQVLLDANGYVRVSIAGQYSSTNTNGLLSVVLVDGDGTGVATIGQQVYAYQVSP